MTPGVRKILTSNKTFANHLADEEAALAQNPHPYAQPPPPPPAAPQNPPSLATAAPGTKSTRRTKRHSLQPQPPPPQPDDNDNDDDDDNAMDIDLPPTLQQPRPTDPTGNEANHLLTTGLPNPPTEAEIQALLSAPPLSYSAAAAALSASTAPGRRFCEVCGYWGRVRCMRCGVKLCGGECGGVHADTGCARFWL